MILITPDAGSSDLDQHLSSIKRQLALIKGDLEILHEQLLAGEIGSETQANKTMGSIKNWIRLAIETEMKIAEQKSIKQVSEAADTILTSPKRGITLGADWIACASVADRQLFLNDLTKGELLALPFLFDFWAMEHQLPPAGDWRSWVIMGGRGAGKTRAGAEWVRSQVEGPRPADCGSAGCVALVGETLD